MYWCVRRTQRLRGLSREYAAARFLGLWVRIPTEAWTFVACEFCVFSLRWVDYSPRGVLPSVVCPTCVIVKPRKGRP
jgi:hypothetical protein